MNLRSKAVLNYKIPECLSGRRKRASLFLSYNNLPGQAAALHGTEYRRISLGDPPGRYVGNHHNPSAAAGNGVSGVNKVNP